MNGADALIATLADGGIEVCFANPGTSEMHLVDAIDRSDMRAVLCLFEGVATGAADGYGRMTGRPAATLLHLGPGLANGLANLHNAKRARTPLINLIGDHASYHLELDAPLTSDISTLAAPMSNFVATVPAADAMTTAGNQALGDALSKPGNIVTLILPADCAWSEVTATSSASVEPRKAAAVDPEDIRVAADLVRSHSSSVIMLGGKALTAGALESAARIAAVCDGRLISETFPARVQRGAGRPQIDRLAYFGEMIADQLADVEHLLLIGAKTPVSFFAYDGKDSLPVPDTTTVHSLMGEDQDAEAWLAALARELDAPAEHGRAQPAVIPPTEDGPLNVMGIGSVLAELMPGNAIVSDESATAGLFLYPMTAGAAPHDWMTLTGGSIGQGLPLAVGAAIACPDRKTLALQADGGGMYTLQALWTMAREKLDITTLIINNSSYAILNIELDRVGLGGAGAKARSLLELSNPPLDWVALAEGMGVPARKADSVASLRDALRDAINRDGPALVEAIV
ncbi:MAG: hypothetical protein DHS20C06_09910 [Hyphobacterium sp.]|nr:MAG: hypothetical protein DHS20C06_09910 [Hyphobacterium sp.]